MVQSNKWQLKFYQLYSPKRNVFSTTLYLVLLNYLFFHTQTLKSSLVWNKLNFFKLRQLAWLDKRVFRKEKNYFSTLPKFLVTERQVTTPKRINIQSRFQNLWFLFLQTWALTRSKSNLHYTTHRDFRLFFLSLSRNAPTNGLVNPRGYYNRWITTYNLLFNLFFVDSFTQVLCSKIFIEEALVFNWEYSYRNYKLFKYVQPFLMFSDLSHGESVHDVIARLLDNQIDFVLVLDFKSHNKFLKHLQSYHVFMIGLTPINYSPWSVSYPIPTFSDSPTAQLLFLKFLLRLQLNARNERYTNQFQLRNRDNNL